jgi:hypothetical protein
MVQTAFMAIDIHWETSSEHLINQSMPNGISPTNHLIFFLYPTRIFTCFSLPLSSSYNKSMSRREIKFQAVNTQWSFGSLHSPRQISQRWAQEAVSVTRTAELSWASLGCSVRISDVLNQGFQTCGPPVHIMWPLHWNLLFIEFDPPQCWTIKFTFFILRVFWLLAKKVKEGLLPLI